MTGQPHKPVTDLARAIEDDLATVAALMDLVQWISEARDYIEEVQGIADGDETVRAAFQWRDFRFASSSWGNGESVGLTNLFMVITGAVHRTRSEAGLA